ncbi:MAG: HlyD family type I secretion periplasmic adaptor subunit [Betaproteobacteria bacterium]|nr:HlyD family type I secretion periplasmic adaptor subunit [Betaproteobacteria bacterium]
MDKRVMPHDALDTIQPETQMPPGAGKRGDHPEPMQPTRKAFEQLGRMKAPGRSLFERFFDRLLPALPDSRQLDWGDEADWARLQQEPIRARWLLRIVVVVVISLLTWAALAEIDEVARGDGKVTPSMGGQTISAVDAGQIEKILVKEGQEVKAGDVLLRIGDLRYRSEHDAGEAKRHGLLARIARLQALTEKREFILPEEVLDRSPVIADQEQRLYQTSLDESNALLSGLREQLTQREQELREVKALHEQAVEGLRYAKLELEQSIPLLASGAVSEFEINKLESNVSKLDGDRKAAVERIGRSEAAISEAKSKIEEAEHGLLSKWRQMLTDASSELASTDAASGISRDKVVQAEVRSPVKGKVQRLHVNTEGQFVPQGKELVEIVPSEDNLLIEAKVKPRDIGFLREGLPVLVKITAYDFSIYGGLEGELEHISSDSITDERSNTFYLIRVRTNSNKLVGKKSAGYGDMKITPGMVAEVDVLTGKKTVLSYLLKPVLRAKAVSMSEK